MNAPEGYDEKDEVIRSILAGLCLVGMVFCFLVVAACLR
jgi:hypothetical protein